MNVTTSGDNIAQEPKDWTKAVRRSKDDQSGGVRIFINFETLKKANIPNNVPLMVHQNACKNGRIILKFKEGNKDEN